MSGGAHGKPFEPFFLPAAGGERFCIFHASTGEPHGTFIYLHPFAEEMNKSRRTAALQSRMFAASGFAVLQIDLFGCGDSSGEFKEARWEIWKQDAALALQWCKQRLCGPIHLWGLRLGALLALDFARTSGEAFGGLLFWQPVTSGASFLTQFLRLQVASMMIAEGAAPANTRELREQMERGNVLEIAGYELAPELALAIERLQLVELVPPATPVHWFEVATEAGRTLSPAARAVETAWVARGVEVSTHVIVGEPFWSTIEIAECPELVAATTRVIAAAR